MSFCKRAVVLLFCGILFGQGDELYLREDVYGWIIKDELINKEFIDKYIELDFDTEVQGNDLLQIFVSIQETGYKLEGVYAENSLGEVTLLSLGLINSKVEKELLNKLLQRKYEWDDIDYQVFSSNSKTVNIYKQKNYKIARDQFWWSNRQFNLNIANSLNVRTSDYGFILEMGDHEVGYPASLSNSISIGVSNDIAKFVGILPMKHFFSSKFINPIAGGVGFGLKFDSPMFGGSVIYKDPSWVNTENDKFKNNENIIFTNWYSTAYYSRTFGIPLGIVPKWGQKYFGRSMTLRIKVGPVFHYLTNTQYDEETNSLRTIAETDFYDFAHIFMRIESVSDQDNNLKKVSKWRGSYQLSFNFNNRVSTSTYFSYAINDIVRIGLYVATFSPLTFSNSTCDTVCEWDPGLIILPEISFSL